MRCLNLKVKRRFATIRRAEILQFPAGPTGSCRLIRHVLPILRANRPALLDDLQAFCADGSGVGLPRPLASTYGMIAAAACACSARLSVPAKRLRTSQAVQTGTGVRVVDTNAGSGIVVPQYRIWPAPGCSERRRQRKPPKLPRRWPARRRQARSAGKDRHNPLTADRGPGKPHGPPQGPRAATQFIRRTARPSAGCWRDGVELLEEVS